MGNLCIKSGKQNTIELLPLEDQFYIAIMSEEEAASTFLQQRASQLDDEMRCKLLQTAIDCERFPVIREVYALEIPNDRFKQSEADELKAMILRKFPRFFDEKQKAKENPPPASSSWKAHVAKQNKPSKSSEEEKTRSLSSSPYPSF